LQHPKPQQPATNAIGFRTFFMHDNRYDLTQVLAAYPAEYRPTGDRPLLVVGGFSGSTIWRFSTSRGPFCLRRWPQEHPGNAQLQWIHSVLARTAAAGFDRIPLPVASIQNATFVESQDHLWELTPWLAGESDETGPPGFISAPTRVAAALAALAQFHLAVSADANHRYPAATAPGINDRLVRVRQLLAGGLENLHREVNNNHGHWPELATRAGNYIKDFRVAAPAIESQLQAAVSEFVAIRPCIRDIHREHVLFDGDVVTGIIDFGAMQPDNVACDIARLLGSMTRNDAASWQNGLAAYQQTNPLTDTELHLVRAYYESTVLLSGINWLRWVFEDRRTFRNDAVLTRFDQNAARLRWLASKSA
jgi:Ser/Thr protein kinase RdoA (MazF antagonist)